MDNRDNVAHKFRVVLCRHLKDRFGKIISAQYFADQFNLNAHGTTAVSRETARRWIRGDAIPDYGHLAALIRWLNINPDDFLGNGCHFEVGKNLQPTPPTQLTPSSNAKNLLRMLDALDQETQLTILAIAKVLARNADAAKYTEYNSNTNSVHTRPSTEESKIYESIRTASAHHEHFNDSATAERLLLQRL